MSISKRAESDLREIKAYIQADQIPQAESWFTDLYRTALSLENLPERGRMLFPEQRYRQIVYGSRPHFYRILYKINKRKQQVVIAHIRHGARQGSGV